MNITRKEAWLITNGIIPADWRVQFIEQDGETWETLEHLDVFPEDQESSFKIIRVDSFQREIPESL